MIDYYEILEVHPKASQEIIKKAYLTLAKKYHPDTTTFDKSFAEQKIKQINEAYRVLSNEQLRSEYDRQRSSNSNDYNTRSSNQSSSRINPMETARNNLYGIFANYLHKLQTKIVKEEGHAYQNSQICKPLLNQFYKDIAADFKVLIDNNAFNGDIASAFVLTLFEFASCFTWCDDFLEADKLMNMAVKYVTPNDEFYSRFISARNSIRESAKKQALHNQQRQTRQNNSYTSSGTTETTNPFLKIIGLIVACVVLYYGCAGGSTSKKSSSYSYNSRPTGSTSVNKYSGPKSTNQPLVPRANIRTGYAPNNAILNNNGYCKLTIDNTRNSEPVYVRLWSTSPSRPVRAFFIAARDSFTMQNLNPGSYELRYKYLYENREAEVGTKSEAFQLTQRETYEGISYSVSTITLYKVANGNFRSTSINANDI